MLIRNGLLATAAVLSFTRLWHSGLPVLVVDRPKTTRRNGTHARFLSSSGPDTDTKYLLTENYCQALRFRPVDPMKPHHSQVCVVVIGYNDADHVTDAVRSALAQGPAVLEVLAVDDRSTDGSADLLDRLAADEPRVKVIRRSANSGGCGSPATTGSTRRAPRT